MLQEKLKTRHRVSLLCRAWGQATSPKHGDGFGVAPGGPWPQDVAFDADGTDTATRMRVRGGTCQDWQLEGCSRQRHGAEGAAANAQQAG